MDLKFEGVDLEYKKAKNNLPRVFLGNLLSICKYKWRENNSRDR
ncbi:degenerate transposase [Streptococcus pneumoniae]|nr:degenerate transposase [Streptococcus pneumoniae]